MMKRLQYRYWVLLVTTVLASLLLYRVVLYWMPANRRNHEGKWRFETHGLADTEVCALVDFIESSPGLKARKIMRLEMVGKNRFEITTGVEQGHIIQVINQEGVWRIAEQRDWFAGNDSLDSDVKPDRCIGPSVMEKVKQDPP